MTDLALSIRGLEFRYPKFSLGPLDLSVPKGVIYAFLGPNGSGKSTCMELILGMGRVRTGTVEVFGFDHIRDDVECKKRIGYASPLLNFDTWRKVGKALTFLRNFYEDWDDAYCLHLLDKFGLGWDDEIPSLSHGNYIKLSVIQALAHHPPLLVLDEPQTGLDALAKRTLYDELLAAVREENCSVFIASHNLAELERYADYAGILLKGRMLLEGKTADLLERFCTVDCTLDNGFSDAAAPGLQLRERQGPRCRFLADYGQGGLESLHSLHARDVHTTPLSLEDLFVALTGER